MLVPTTAAEATDGLRQAFPRLVDADRLGRRSLEELEELRLGARRFARMHIAPRALDVDARHEHDPGHFDWNLVRLGAQERLLSMLVPQPAGGLGGMAIECSLIMEELSAACPGIGLIFGAHALGVAPLIVSGGAGAWDGVLRDIVEHERRGDPQLMAFAITEPGVGTDAEDPDLLRTARLATRARRVPGGFRLSGVKHFISNGSVARWVTVMMAVDRERPVQTLSTFLVDTRSAGFSVARVERKMGQRACPAAEIVFDDVFVPDELVVGRPGDGMATTMLVLATSRGPVGAIATGIARGAYERLLAWLRESPDAEGLIDRQHVQLELAQMAESIHLARQAYLDAATQLDLATLGRAMRHPVVRAAAHPPGAARRWEPVRRRIVASSGRDAARLLRRTCDDRGLTRALAAASMAKAHGGDAAVRVTSAALDLVGPGGGVVRAELEKLWRDAKLTQIYEGTNQLNRQEVFRGVCVQDTLPMLPRRLAPELEVVA